MYNYQNSPALTHVTFSGNTATDYGGGMYNNYYSSPPLTHVTFSGNSATSGGGGMYNEYSSSPKLTNVIIADSSSGGDCVNNVSTLNAASSNNLIEDAGNACGLTNGANGNIIGSDPALDPPLADNGGSTQTHALLAGSPAINAGTNTGCPATDQRGGSRPQGAVCDIGAYEAQSDVALGKAALPSAAMPGQAITFTLTLSNTGSITATHVVVTDTLPTILSGLPFTSTLTVTDTGHTPSYVWAVQDLAPGQGGVITITGALTTPLAAGVYTNTAVIAAEGDLLAENNTAVVTFTVPNVAPAFTSAPVAAATQNALYTYTATAEDDNGDALTLTATTKPAWLTLTDHSDGTATLTGTPTNADVGAHAVVLRVTDNGGLFATQVFTITVTEKPKYYLYLPLTFKNTP